MIEKQENTTLKHQTCCTTCKFLMNLFEIEKDMKHSRQLFNYQYFNLNKLITNCSNTKNKELMYLKHKFTSSNLKYIIC